MGIIEKKFKKLKSKKKKAFIVYLSFGYPTISLTKKIIKALDEVGVDFIELGIPFSDPLADGPILQKASQIALEQGANTDKLTI